MYQLKLPIKNTSKDNSKTHLWKSMDERRLKVTKQLLNLLLLSNFFKVEQQLHVSIAKYLFDFFRGLKTYFDNVKPSIHMNLRVETMLLRKMETIPVFWGYALLRIILSRYSDFYTFRWKRRVENSPWNHTLRHVLKCRQDLFLNCLYFKSNFWIIFLEYFPVILFWWSIYSF